MGRGYNQSELLSRLLHVYKNHCMPLSHTKACPTVYNSVRLISCRTTMPFSVLVCLLLSLSLVAGTSCVCYSWVSQLLAVSRICLCSPYVKGFWWLTVFHEGTNLSLREPIVIHSVKERRKLSGASSVYGDQWSFMSIQTITCVFTKNR